MCIVQRYRNVQQKKECIVACETNKKKKKKKKNPHERLTAVFSFLCTSGIRGPDSVQYSQ